MGSKNNLKLRSEKMAQRKAKYKIKKLNVGVASALCPVKYTDQIDKNFRRLGCGIVPRSSRFCLCKRVWY